MRRLAAAFGLLVVLCWSSLALAQAQGEITVDSQTYDNHFPQDITFHLKAQGTQSITKVTLYYRVGSSASDSYVYPTFTPGPSVQADYVLATGGAHYIVPGAIIQYYYQIDDAAGNQLKTQPATLTYDDTRFTWQKIQGDQLTVYWYALQPVAQQVFQTGQATLAKMKSEAGESLARPVKLYVYASKGEMDVALPFQSRTSSQDIITEGEAFPEADEVMILGTVQDIPGTTAHELTHLITDQLTSNPFAGIPTWLNEGLSMYAEGELRGVNQQALNAGIRGNSLLNLHTISSLPGR
ncbi:MAG: peptidase MA family metallohydrolase, partial [Dehalococcoidia bacterium]|nr:peptidase MA family metallohydrolase [Dehalococcoidia bacterium]